MRMAERKLVRGSYRGISGALHERKKKITDKKISFSRISNKQSRCTLFIDLFLH